MTDDPRPRKDQEQAGPNLEHYRLLADHMSDVIWTLDLEGNFTYVSPSVERLRGYKPEEIVGLPLEGALLPEEAAEVRAAAPQMIELFRSSRTAQVRRFITQPCRDGSTVPSEIVVNGMYDSEGNLVAILGVTRDITDQHRVERELRQAKEVAERALAEVGRLKDLIPICSNCKNVRDDKGYWEQVEEYISSQTGVQFTHSLCPNCAPQFFPECFDEPPSPPGEAEGGASPAVPA